MHGVHRYVKPTRRTSGPVKMICAVPEYPPILDCVTDGEAYYSARAVWSMTSRRYGSKWRGDEEPTRYHPDDWWDHVSRQVAADCRLYVVCPSAGDLATATGFWVRMDRGEYTLCAGGDSGSNANDGSTGRRGRWIGRLVLGGPPDIIHVRHKKGSVLLVSLRNYTEAGWDKLASAVQYTTDTEGVGVSGHTDRDVDEVDKCIVESRYMRQLISGWIDRKCGPWRDTAAQLSVAWWRNSFYTHKVCRHESTEAITLERQASYGGRNEVWYYGDTGDPATVPDGADPAPTPSQYPPIPGAVYRCDVSAQYPAILATEAFPVRLKATVDNVSVADLEAITRYYGVIANVTIRTSAPEFPRRQSREADYPTGKFDTTLAGPELLRALQAGCVVGVRSAAYYEMGHPLRTYASHLLRERERARESGDYCGELFAKCLATAIGGKFSQRTTRRDPRPNIVNPFSRWGPFTIRGADGSVQRYVSVAGLSYEEVQAETGGKLLAAVYCYLTSYGRVQMTRLRESLLPVVPYSQCTDGIWVGEEGIRKLAAAGLSSDRTPGTLRLVSSHSYARWMTPNHYYVDGRWTLAGYRYGSTVLPDLSVVEYRETNAIRTVAYKPPMKLKRRPVKRELSGIGSSCRIGPDGWMIPPTVKG